MGKKTIAMLFTLLFLAFITAPSIIVVIDDSVDVSMFYSIAEEENENLKLTFPDTNFNECSGLITSDLKDNLGYVFKHYPKPHLNLISPPPDFI